MTGHCGQAVQCPPICACKADVEGGKGPQSAEQATSGHVPYPSWLRAVRALVREERG